LFTSMYTRLCMGIFSKLNKSMPIIHWLNQVHVVPRQKATKSQMYTSQQ
jgi:hypothetical protein